MLFIPYSELRAFGLCTLLTIDNAAKALHQIAAYFSAPVHLQRINVRLRAYNPISLRESKEIRGLWTSALVFR